MDQSKIRNFCIIAHIDHGKSTLADRLLEITGTIAKNKLQEQFLDRMDIERERGITIKLQPVRMSYRNYILNLIDTPGHVDFSYEVSRSLAAVEGALLVVDAAQGIEAQTLSNAYLAVEQGLKIIPVINKIDLPQAQVEAVMRALQETFAFREDEIIKVSAKTGENVEAILDAVIERIPHPRGSKAGELRALIFDSHYDKFKGVITHIRVVDGVLSAGKAYTLIASQSNFQSLEVGIFNPDFLPKEFLETGEIGYVATGLKDVALTRVGDTVTTSGSSAVQLPGYKTITPMVFAGVYPIDTNEYPRLREALEKLRLNDASLSYEPENSEALGFGFRCGFLGLLHMDVIKERLEREYALSIILSSPSVKYEALLTSGKTIPVESPVKLPDQTLIREIREPVAAVTIIVTEEYLGKIMELINYRRGVINNVEYLGGNTNQHRVKITSLIPLSEIITDFFDRLKSLSSGYASLDYEVSALQVVDAIKLEILVSGQIVDALARIVPREHSERLGKELVEKLRDIIPKQQYEVSIQAAMGGSKGVVGKIIARADVKAFRKDVTGYLYGGDRTRKDKLLDKQKAGKKKMKKIGKFELPQEAFLTILKH